MLAFPGWGLMDAVKSFWAQLLAKTGLDVSSEAALVAGLALTVLVVVIALLFGRRSSRLEERFMDPGTFQPSLPNAQLSALSDEVPKANTPIQSSSGGSISHASDPGGDTTRLALDLANLRDGMASVLPGTKAEFMAVQESVQNYQERIELLRTTLNSLQSEQLTLHKLLEACNADLQDIERFAASVPKLRSQHASIKKQLTELNERFHAVSEVLADFLPSQDPLNDR